MAPSIAVHNAKLRRPLRAFTLIELMVALTAGLFFSVAVFMLMRDVSRYFQRESRVADATMGAILGFERLKADVARAGYLASPLLIKDPRRCPKPPAPLTTSGWASFTPLAQMGALYITRGNAGVNMTAAGQALLTANALTPDRIRMYGNYQTAEQFVVEAISPTGTIQLSIVGAGALLRLGYNPTALAADLDALLLNAFPPGRALRIVSPEGDEQYAIIQTASSIPDGPTNRKPVIQVGPTLNLIFKAASTTCGINGSAANGYLVNTVNIIEYELDDTLVATDPNYQELGLGNAGNPGARTDLVRFEVNPQTGAPIGTRELVAEYAVDLRLGITAVTDPLTGQMASFAPGNAGMDPYTIALAAATINNGPHLIRGVRAQLTVRSRAPDREAQIAAPPAGGLYRVALPVATGPIPFARARTLSATIATRNTRGMLWQ
jgi:hypothetical protein